MAINRMIKKQAYGSLGVLQDLSPLPIKARRAPTTADLGQIGQLWLDGVGNDAYVLLEVVSNSASWLAIGSGGGSFDTLTVAGATTLSALGLGVVLSSAGGLLSSETGTDGQLLIGGTAVAPAWASLASGDGSVVIATGSNTLDIRVSGAAASTFPSDAGTATPVLGATTLAGGTNMNTSAAGGTVTFNVDAAPTFAGLVTAQAGITQSAGTATIVSDTNAAQAIYLHADAGVGETIQLHSDQGTLVNSVYLLSDVGGLTLEATGLASDDAINVTASAGGIDVDAALQLNLASSENAADAVVISASAGGIDITSAGAAGEDIDISTSSSINLVSNENAAEAIYLHADAGATETIHIHSDQGTNAASIYVHSDVGGVTLDSGLASDDAINLSASAGGVDIDGALQVNIASSENTVDAVVIEATAGGVQILASGAAATEDIAITATGSSVVVTSTEDDAGAVYLHANGGTSERIRLHSDQGTGVDSVMLESDVGGITLSAPGLASADAINLSAAAGGVDIDSALQMNLASAQAAATAIVILASDAAGGIDIDAGTGGIDLLSTGAINFTGGASSSLDTTGAGIDLSLTSAAGRVIVTAGEDAADAIYLHADAGTSEKIRIHADQGTATDSVALASDVGGIAVTSGLDASDCIYLHANAGTSEKIRVHADQGTGLDSIELESDAGGVLVTTAALAANTGLHVAQGAQTAAIQVGTGAPVHSAPQGSLYLRTDGSSTSTRLYANSDGATGWVNFTSAS